LLYLAVEFFESEEEDRKLRSKAGWMEEKERRKTGKRN